MKILIIGGTGATGRELIKQALEQRHEVTVLVRRPEKLETNNPLLKIMQGNVLNREDVQQAVIGQNAVLSVLGHKKFFIKTNILSEGTKNIVEAMEQQHVDRFICVTSLGIGDSRFKLGLYYTLFVIPFIILFYFLDKEKQEKLIRNSKLDWTIVRPGQLTNGKRTGTYKHGPNVGSYILTKMISRANVAHFMLRQLEDRTYSRKAVGII